MEAGATLAPKAIRVLISYSRTDGSETAREPSKLLNEAGHTVWLDIDNIHSGDNWTKELDSALANCDILLAVLTQGSHNSGICRSEQVSAMEQGKRIIPILTAPTVPARLTCIPCNTVFFPMRKKRSSQILDFPPALRPQTPSARLHRRRKPLCSRDCRSRHGRHR